MWASSPSMVLNHDASYLPSQKFRGLHLLQDLNLTVSFKYISRASITKGCVQSILSPSQLSTTLSGTPIEADTMFYSHESAPDLP